MEKEDGDGMPKPPIIRRAKMKDSDRIIELVSELGRPEPKNEEEIKHFAKLSQNYISEKDKIILVAEVDSKVVGMISLVFLPRLNRNKPEAWIPEFIVDKEYRNKGIGRELLKECIRIAKGRNAGESDLKQDYLEKMLRGFTK